MGLFKRVPVQRVVLAARTGNALLVRTAPPPPAGYPPDLAAQIQRLLQAARSQVFAYSEYVKQVECTRCGAAKQLPSKTAYLYCDHCGSLVDYDFRAGNFGTNAALTNQVFACLIAPVKNELDKAIVLGDRDRYRQLMYPVYTEWVRQLPMAVSPRANSEDDFRQQTIRYIVEGMVCRDFTPELLKVSDELKAATNRVQRIPQPGGDWQVDEHIWEVAALYKKQMEMTYDVVAKAGLLELEPERTPVDIQMRMEYSYFCQNWLPKIPPADVDRFLGFFGLRAEYRKADITTADTRKCGNCGDELKTVPGAQAVVCESCGKKLDIAGGEVPCQQCGAPLSFPVGVSAITCPYCKAATHRV
jgi:LSD1 subclass zinc finger protein